MELNFIRLFTSILMIALGIFYFIKPISALKLMHFMNKDYEPSNLAITQYKYGGLLLSGLGIYYILVMFEAMPMIKI